MAVEKRERKSEEIATYVIRQIEQGAVQVGDRLPSERDLSQQLGVSRPLVREGYRILESLGVVEVRLGSGVYVTERKIYSPQDGQIWQKPIEILDVIAVADVMAWRCGELAARQITDAEIATLRELHSEQARATDAFDLETLADIDDKFHRTIVLATHNPILESFELLSRHLLNRDRVLLLGTAADKSLIEHGQIINALEARDPVSAGLALRFHSVRSHAVMRSLIERQASLARKGE